MGNASTIIERRRAVRYKPDVGLFAAVKTGSPGGEPADYWLPVKDISEGGICILLPRRFLSSQSFQVTLVSPSGLRTGDLPAGLAWQNERKLPATSDREFRAGLRFDSPKRLEGELERLLSQVSREFQEVKSWERKLGGQVCRRCILTSRVPGISFDENGICNFCRDYEEKELPVEKKRDYPALEAELVRVLKANPRKHPYDCLCLYSGGKDSTYMLYLLVKRYHLRVLAFTFDNYFIAPETFLNMKRALSQLSVDHILFKPSWESNKGVFRTGMTQAHRLEAGRELAFMIGHACWPCFTQIAMHSIKLAADKNIPSVVVGTTPGQIRQKKYDLVSKFNGLVDVYRNMVQPMLELLRLTNQEGLKKSLEISFWKQLKVLRMKLVPFYEYVPYSEEKVLETVRQELGWESPRSTDSCSTNCQLNSLGIQIHKDQYGLSPYVIPLARDVREGLVERTEALRAVSADLNPALVRNIARQFDYPLDPA